MRAILFDLDGTLLDSFDDIVACTHYTLAAVGRPLLPAAQIRALIGDGPGSLLTRCVEATGGGDETSLQQMVEIFSPWYAEHCLDASDLYAGARQLLGKLRGTTLALVSNKPEQVCRSIISRLGLEDTFEVIAGGDTYLERKPDPGPLRRTLARLEVPPQQAVMVGDGVQDIRAGRAAGVRTIGVGWGLNPSQLLEDVGADHVVHSMDMLGELLLRLR